MQIIGEYRQTGIHGQRMGHHFHRRAGTEKTALPAAQQRRGAFANPALTADIHNLPLLITDIFAGERGDHTVTAQQQTLRAERAQIAAHGLQRYAEVVGQLFNADFAAPGDQFNDGGPAEFWSHLTFLQHGFP